MNSTLRKIALLGAGFLALALVVVLLNQTVQLAEVADRFHPLAGTFVFWFLIFTYLACAGVPIVLLLRLPKPLRPPATDAGPEFDRHLERLRRRLATNPRLKRREIRDRADVEEALAELSADSEEIVKAAASKIFLTTAISQNGALDSLLVLGLQSKLVWDVAHVYAQRPALSDLTYLYANVVGTAFVAGEIDEADLSEQVQPVLSAVLGSAASAVPGLQTASTVFVNSVVSGTANAFLTLRVGLIAQDYCRALVRPEKKTLRRTALTRAGSLLGSIAVAGAAKVASAVTRASGKTVTDAVTGAGRKVKKAGGAIADRLSFRRRDIPEDR